MHRATYGFPARTRRRANAGTARRGFRAGVDQVGNRLGLGEIDLSVEKGTLAELSRFSHAQSGQPALAAVGVDFFGRLEAACEQQLQHHRTAVRLQFEHVLPSEGMRGGK